MFTHMCAQLESSRQTRFEAALEGNELGSRRSADWLAHFRGSRSAPPLKKGLSWASTLRWSAL
eukprot:4311120-Prymnesium_polylepis.1